MSAVFAYIHTLSMIALGAMLFAQLLTFEVLRTPPGLRRFLLLSNGVVIAVALALASGIALLIWTSQGGAFYLRNPVFYIKLAIFAAILLIAVTPARIIIQWHRNAKIGQAADSALPEPGMVQLVRRYLIFEMILLLVIPLAASLASRGIGLQLSAS